MEPTTIIIIVIGLLLLSGLLSACCRRLKKAYEAQLSNEDRARRAQAFYISQASRNIQNLNDGRQVRVTTITRDSDSVAYEIYEIHVPSSRSNRNQDRNTTTDTPHTNSSNIMGRTYNPNRLVRLSHPASAGGVTPEISRTPPPAFNIALQVSTPIPSTTNPLPEEPPPSYEESKKLQLRY